MEVETARAFTVLRLAKPQYRWSVADETVATLAPSAAPSGTVVIAPTGRNGKTTLRLEDTANGVWKEIELILGTGMGTDSASLYAAWAAQAFPNPADRQNPAVSGPDADPNGDGVPNLLEYAFNLQPARADAAALVPVSGTGGLPRGAPSGSGAQQRLRVEFVRRKQVDGAGPIIRCSSRATPAPSGNPAESRNP